MNSTLIRLIGVIQFIFIILSFYLFRMDINILSDLYMDILQYIPSNSCWQIFYENFVDYTTIFSFLIIIFLFISFLFALYLNLNKLILFQLLTIGVDTFLRFFPFFIHNYFISMRFPMQFYITPIMYYGVLLITILLKIIPNYRERSRIKREILDLGIMYPDFKLKEVSQKCHADKNTIINVTKKMIKRKEIYAEYFSISKKFAFNISANIEEIDRLIAIYKEWEEETFGKK
jgi:hypothetical protein